MQAEELTTVGRLRHMTTLAAPFMPVEVRDGHERLLPATLEITSDGKLRIVILDEEHPGGRHD